MNIASFYAKAALRKNIYSLKTAVRLQGKLYNKFSQSNSGT